MIQKTAYGFRKQNQHTKGTKMGDAASLPSEAKAGTGATQTPKKVFFL